MRYNQLVHMVIRVAKQDSAFIYFILEASEGLFFYSTLKHSLAQKHRDVDIKGSISLIDEIKSTMNQIKNQYPLEIISHNIIDDC